MADYHDNSFFNSRFFCDAFFQHPFFSKPFFRGMHTHCATLTDKATAIEAHVTADHQVMIKFDKVISIEPSHYTVTVDGTPKTVIGATYHPSDDHVIIVTINDYSMLPGTVVLVSHTGADDVNAFTDLAADNPATMAAPPPPPKVKRRAKPKVKAKK
jgi:hypothetical protein